MFLLDAMVLVAGGLVGAALLLLRKPKKAIAAARARTNRPET